MKILIRTDAGLQIGNGHIIRMMALADQLVSKNINIAFALKSDDFWIAHLTEKGYQTFRISQNLELSTLIGKEKITHLIYDTRNDLTATDLRDLKEKLDVKIVVIDSPEDVRLVADVNILPPIPQVKEWRWDGFYGKIFSGWEYVLLRNEFSNDRKSTGKTNRILLSFGSTDPFHLTEWALQNLDGNSLLSSFEFVLVVGPQFDRLNAVRQLEGFQNLKVTIAQSPENIVEIFQSVDFAIIALGVTAYELTALSVPFLFVSISDDHAKTGEVFEANGLGYSLGTVNKSLDQFEKKINQFMSQYLKTRQMSFADQHKICDWQKIIAAITN